MNNMWEFIRNNLSKNPDAIICEYGSEQKYRYKELLNYVESVGNKCEFGIFSGAKCAVLCKRSIEMCKALFFGWHVGMVVIPLSLHYGKEHYQEIIKAVNVDVIITDEMDLCKDLGINVCLNINNIVVPDYLKIDREEDLIDVEIILCTSGTTGIPKASMFTADAICKNAALISSYFCVDKSDTVLICRPLYHCAVLVGELLLSLMNGANIVFFSDEFHPFMLANILASNEITIMCGTPTLFKAIAECMKYRKLSGKLKRIALSGESLINKYAKDIRNCFPDAEIFNVYGLTEAGPRVSFLPQEMFDIMPQSVGIPLTGIEIRVVDDKSREQRVGEWGHIWIKSPTMMKGYYKEPEMTRDKMNAGWLMTGDIGKIDERGYLLILGRSDDMIIRSGMNIYPQEVERKLLKLKEIKEARVYGEIVDNIEHIFVEIVLEEKYRLTTKNEIMKVISGILPQYMMPTGLRIVNELPHNASGKLIRKKKNTEGGRMKL